MFHESTPRKVQVAVRLTAEEREFVQSAAAEAGVTVGRLMRQAFAHEIERLAVKRERNSEQPNRLAASSR